MSWVRATSQFMLPDDRGDRRRLRLAEEEISSDCLIECAPLVE